MSFTHQLALLLQRVPLINRIPVVSTAHTVEGAIGGLFKAVDRLVAVSVLHSNAAAAKTTQAEQLRAEASDHNNMADRASAVAYNLSNLTNPPVSVPAASAASPAQTAGQSA